jgi:hypothetical protein
MEKEKPAHAQCTVVVKDRCSCILAACNECGSNGIDVLRPRALAFFFISAAAKSEHAKRILQINLVFLFLFVV